MVTLDPAYAGETTNLFIHINTYDTLVDIRPDDLNTIVPRLAETWEVNPGIHRIHLPPAQGCQVRLRQPGHRPGCGLLLEPAA